MADNLRIFGNTYTGANSIKATDVNGNEVVYTAGGGGGGDIYTVTGTYNRDPSTGALSVSVTNNIEDVIAAVRSGKYLTARIATAEAGASDTLYLAVHSVYDFDDTFDIKFVSPLTSMMYSTGSLWCENSYLLGWNGESWYLETVANETPIS